MMIDGNTRLIAHLGTPTHSFKAPLIYNPYFAHAGINAVVVPMDCPSTHFLPLLESLFSLGNMAGALITMPYKVRAAQAVQLLSPTAQVAMACNAVRRNAQGELVGDMFDGSGFVRGLRRKGLMLEGARALVVGCGGVGSAIAASLAAAGVAELRLADPQQDSALQLQRRLRSHYPRLAVQLGNADPTDMDLAVNASPLGMRDDDPLPFDCSRLQASTWVGEVVMRQTLTPLLEAAQARGCRIQIGLDMLFEQIPAYLEFFGLPSTSPEHLRQLAQIPGLPH